MSEIGLFELILKGMAIGFLAAAPTGPSGVHVIQRTLNKGRWKGFLTGLGVTISDAVYIMITMMCLSLVLGYLEDQTIATVVCNAGDPGSIPGYSCLIHCYVFYILNLAANAGDIKNGLTPLVKKVPWRRKCQPTPVFLPGKFHGQRSLAW